MGEHDSWGRQEPQSSPAYQQEQTATLPSRVAAPGTIAGSADQPPERPTESPDGQTRATEPGATESAATEPGATEPGGAHPAAADPGGEWRAGSDWTPSQYGTPGQPGAPGQYGTPGQAPSPYQPGDEYRSGYQPAGQYPSPGSQYQPAGQYQQTGQYQPAGQYQQTGQYQPAGQYQQTGQYPAVPPYQPDAGTHGTHRSGSGRTARGMLLVFAAVALSLGSGVVGGLIVEQSATPQPRETVTRAGAPAPQIDRSSVAGVAEGVLPSVVSIRAGQGEGSGVILSADGAIVTNNHVVAGVADGAVTVTFSDGKTARATVVGTDPIGDLAVIKAQGVSNLAAAKFGDSSAARVGDTVLAIGSPLGLQGSVSEGIVSALHRTIRPSEGGRSIGDAIQTDAAINPGNSGGALVNMAGEVIGINTAIATSGQGAGNIGVGFAISSNKAKAAAEQLLTGGKVSHPYMGVQLADGDGGALIADVVDGGPAAKAGLRKGDIITKAGSRAIADSSGLVATIQTGKPGDAMELTVKRGGAEERITVTLAETP